MKIEKVEKYRVGDQEFDSIEAARAARGAGDVDKLAAAAAGDIQEAVSSGKGDLADAITRLYSRISKKRAADKKAAA